MKTVNPTLEQTIENMKREIISDMLRGQVPTTVTSFSELHDYGDANYYGGLCNDEVVDSLIEQFGGRDKDEGMPDDFLEYMNAAQNAVHTWLEDKVALATFSSLHVEKGFDGHYVLIHANDGAYYMNGELVKVHNRDDAVKIIGGSAPHKEGANGYVILEEGGRCYASAASVKWVKFINV